MYHLLHDKTRIFLYLSSEILCQKTALYKRQYSEGDLFIKIWVNYACPFLFLPCGQDFLFAFLCKIYCSAFLLFKIADIYLFQIYKRQCEAFCDTSHFLNKITGETAPA